MRYIPSAKTLRDRFGKMLAHNHDWPIAHARLRVLRNTLVAWRDGRISAATALSEANDLLGGHGVEPIRVADRSGEGFDQLGAEYVNMGDAYVCTLLCDHERCRFDVMDWGTWVERAERRGVKIP